MRASTCIAAAAAALLSSTGCESSREAAPPPKEPASAHGAAAGPVLPFLADDYAGAIAEARARDLPLFVESWAPW